MWVADASGDAIHRVEADGSSVRYPLAAGTFPISLVKGPDGAIWYTAGAPTPSAGWRSTAA